MVEHRKPEGALPLPEEESKAQKRGQRFIEEDDGFMKVTR